MWALKWNFFCLCLFNFVRHLGLQTKCVTSKVPNRQTSNETAGFIRNMFGYVLFSHLCSTHNVLPFMAVWAGVTVASSNVNQAGRDWNSDCKACHLLIIWTSSLWQNLNLVNCWHQMIGYTLCPSFMILKSNIKYWYITYNNFFKACIIFP